MVDFVQVKTKLNVGPIHQAIGLHCGRDPSLDPVRDQEDCERRDLASQFEALARRLGFRLLLQLSLWIWV